MWALYIYFQKLQYIYKKARKKYSEEEKQSEPVRYGADVRAFREFKIIDQYSMLKALMRMVSNIEYQVGISAVRRNYGKKKKKMKCYWWKTQ